LLADACVEILGRHVETVSTKGADIVCSSGVATNLRYCLQEEADTRLCCMLQMLSEVVGQGLLFELLTQICLFYVSHTGSAYLTSANCGLHLVEARRTQSFLHTSLLSSWDTASRQHSLAFIPSLAATLSCFCGRDKRTAWDTWLALPEATRTFTHISLLVVAIPDDVSDIFERFDVLM